MKKILVSIVTLAVLSSCSTSPKRIDYSGSFDNYSSAVNKQEYCQHKIQPNANLDECVHQLIIYERASVSCKEAPLFDQCMTLNKNRWSYEYLKMERLLDNLAYTSGAKAESGAADKNLLAMAPKFVIFCSPDIACKTQ